MYWRRINLKNYPPKIIVIYGNHPLVYEEWEIDNHEDCQNVIRHYLFDLIEEKYLSGQISKEEYFRKTEIVDKIIKYL